MPVSLQCKTIFLMASPLLDGKVIIISSYSIERFGISETRQSTLIPCKRAPSLEGLSSAKPITLYLCLKEVNSSREIFSPVLPAPTKRIFLTVTFELLLKPSL